MKRSLYLLLFILSIVPSFALMDSTLIVINDKFEVEQLHTTRCCDSLVLYDTIKIKIENTSDQSLNLVLKTTRYSSIGLFKSQKLVGVSGYEQPIDEREIVHSNISIIPFIAEKGSNTFIAVIDQTNRLDFEYAPISLTVESRNSLQENATIENRFLFFFFGLIALLCILNLVNFAQFKRRSFILFAIYNIATLLFVVIQSGFLETLLFEDFTYHEILIIVIGNVHLTTYILISTLILNLKQKAPKSHSILMKIVYGHSFLLLPAFWGYPLITVGLGSLVALITYGIVLTNSWKLAFKKDKEARLFFLGNTFHFIGIITSIVIINSPFDTIWGSNAVSWVIIGSSLELFLYSLSITSNFMSIVERNKLLQSEKQKVQQEAEFKQQFLANMSHEIRTPLNGVIGMLDILKTTNLEVKQQEYLKTIDNSAKLLMNIINDILDLTKIQAGKLKLVYGDFNFAAFIEDSYGTYKSIIEEKGIHFSCSIDPKIPEDINADRNRLLQVLNNLLSNAYKFTQEGSIHIECVLESEGKIKISVLDSGIGISEDIAQKLFNKFYQVNDSKNHLSVKGTGLGLAICKDLIRMMEGEIEAHPREEKGSAFSFTFCYRAAKSLKPKEESVKNSEEHPKLGMKVLLVEDNKVNQKVASLMLSALDCSFEIANNGQEAVDLALSNPYDVILMDIQMPVKDGIEAMKELKVHPNFNQSPIIGLSANVIEGGPDQFKKMGFDDYITKPVTITNLKAGLLGSKNR